jgi:hypothetical protein
MLTNSEKFTYILSSNGHLTTNESNGTKTNLRTPGSKRCGDCINNNNNINNQRERKQSIPEYRGTQEPQAKLLL